MLLYSRQLNKQQFYSPVIQDNLGEPVLSQRTDLLEQPLDFYELDVLPATLPTVSKHFRKTQRFGRLLFYTHGISTTCLNNSVKHCRKTTEEEDKCKTSFSSISPAFEVLSCFLLDHRHMLTKPCNV